MTVEIKEGIPVEKAREIVKLIKDQKLKVQPAMHEEQVRVSGKNRDDLQTVIAMLKSLDLDVPLTFSNYRSQ